MEITDSILMTLTDSQLLRLNNAIPNELMRRGICRTANNPIGDYTEWLVAKKLGLNLVNNCEQGYDAIDPETSEKYEIKARRVSKKNPSTQLSAIRDIASGHFDFLVAVVYDENSEIVRALKIPYFVAVNSSTLHGHTNSHRLFADDKLAGAQGVENITHLLKEISPGIISPDEEAG